MCFDPLPDLRSRLWPVTTAGARRNPRVKSFAKVALGWFRGGHAAAIE